MLGSVWIIAKPILSRYMLYSAAAVYILGVYSLMQRNKREIQLLRTFWNMATVLKQKHIGVLGRLTPQTTKAAETLNDNANSRMKVLHSMWHGSYNKKRKWISSVMLMWKAHLRSFETKNEGIVQRGCCKIKLKITPSTHKPIKR